MRVHHGGDVRPHAVDGEMHGDLRGAAAAALDHVAVQVAHRQVVGAHHAFAHAGWGAKDPIRIQPYGDVAIVGGYPALLENEPSDFNDVGPVLPFGPHHRSNDCISELRIPDYRLVLLRAGAACG